MGAKTTAGQGRQSQAQGIRVSHAGYFVAAHPTVAHIASAVMLGIGIENLLVIAGSRHPDAIPLTRHRGEIQHHQAEIVAVAAHIADHRMLRVVAIHPIEAFLFEIVAV